MVFGDTNNIWYDCQEPNQSYTVASGWKNMQTTSTTYPSGCSREELDRLHLQAALSDEMTRNLLVHAEVKSGMRVLDVGSGTGSVALVAAELVGSTGEVTGIDLSPEAVELARKRARDFGFSNVRFREGDLTRIAFDRPFDAIIGRFVLMHFTDPVAVLRDLVRHVKPGGIVAFQEPDYSGVRFSTPLPLCAQCLQWISTTVRRLGGDPDMGLKLHSTFVSAGLPRPFLRLEASIGGRDDFPGFEMTTQLIATLLPAMERMAVTSREEVGLDRLTARLRAEVLAANAVAVLPNLIGAWVHVDGTDS